MMMKELKPLDRKAMFAEIDSGKEFDIVIIGGGASGLGVAVDASSQGYSVCLVEAQDFAAGTSSRSTKLIHGGVRYMQNPHDWGLVFEALRERELLLKLVPNLVHKNPFILPCYRWYEKAFYGLGLTFYTMMAKFSSGDAGSLSILSKEETLEKLPGIKAEGLYGGVRFYDAQFDDARMAIALMHTAVAHGAVCLNYVACDGFNHTDEKIESMIVEDKETGEKHTVKGKMFFNCAGPWVDEVRKLTGKKDVKPFVKAARGSHIILDLKKFGNPKEGMFIPKTSDGRVLFCLPWHGMLEVGTTDLPEPVPVNMDPKISDQEIDFMMANCNNYLKTKVTREDILATFVGVRPLYTPANASASGGKTAKVSREHAIIPEFGNMLTITGGKWTAYRNMAEHAMKVAAEKGLIPSSHTITTKLPLTVDTAFDAEAIEMRAAQAEKVEDVVDDVVAFAIREVQVSGARNADDVLFRRLRLGQMNTKRTEELRGPVQAAIDKELKK